MHKSLDSIDKQVFIAKVFIWFSYGSNSINTKLKVNQGKFNCNNLCQNEFQANV